MNDLEREILSYIGDDLKDTAKRARAKIDAQAKRITELEAENKRLRELTEWKPIETAPVKKMVLVHDTEEGTTELAFLDLTNKWFNYDFVELNPNPTHWMQLPEPPKEQPHE